MPKQQHAMMTESVIAMIFLICDFPFCFFKLYHFDISFAIDMQFCSKKHFSCQISSD